MRTTGDDREVYGWVFVQVQEPVAAAPVEEELTVRVRLQQHTHPHSQKPNAIEGEGGRVLYRRVVWTLVLHVRLEREGQGGVGAAEQAADHQRVGRRRSAQGHTNRP